MLNYVKYVFFLNFKTVKYIKNNIFIKKIYC